jgi:hypothetical protein
MGGGVDTPTGLPDVRQDATSARQGSREAMFFMSIRKTN